MTAGRIVWLVLLGWSSGVFSVLVGIAFFLRVLEAPIPLPWYGTTPPKDDP